MVWQSSKRLGVRSIRPVERGVQPGARWAPTCRLPPSRDLSSACSGRLFASARPTFASRAGSTSLIAQQMARDQVQPPAVELHELGLRGGHVRRQRMGAPQYAADAGEKFTRLERFSQVIVGVHLEPDDTRPATGECHDRRQPPELWAGYPSAYYGNTSPCAASQLYFFKSARQCRHGTLQTPEENGGAAGGQISAPVPASVILAANRSAMHRPLPDQTTDTPWQTTSIQ